jgi:hypothetical protein
LQDKKETMRQRSSLDNVLNTLLADNEVLYSEGATPLFLAIEESEWYDAVDLARGYPEQVQTWVVSTQNDSGNLWRRLPIHEACRKGAPAWMVATLLSPFPESAYKKTNYDELPLHLAVDFAASPEVVNLILLANIDAIDTKDKSERTPLDIIGPRHSLQTPEESFVHESLSRCYKSYSNVRKGAVEKQPSLQKETEKARKSWEHEHQEGMEKAEETRVALEQNVEELLSIIREMKEIDTCKDRKIKKLEKDKEKCKDNIENMKIVIGGLNQELQEAKTQYQSIPGGKSTHHDKQILGRDRKIEELSNDLRNIALMYDTNIMERLEATEQSMRVMVSTQITLKKYLSEQATGLTALLDERQIPLSLPENYADEEEEKKADNLSNASNYSPPKYDNISDALAIRQRLLTREGKHYSKKDSISIDFNILTPIRNSKSVIR